MPTIRATGNRDPPNRCVREFMTRHNRGVGIIGASAYGFESIGALIHVTELCRVLLSAP